MIPSDAWVYESHPNRGQRLQHAPTRHGLVSWGHDSPVELTVSIVWAVVEEQ